MRFTAFIIVSLMVLHPVMGMDAPSLRKKKVSKKTLLKKQSEADLLCRRLLETARAIEALLKSVTDSASANSAAPQLQTLLQQMRELLAGLEQLPFDAETTQTITKYMTDLTHVTQSYMPLVQQLITEQAYGSQALMAQLQSHHSENDYAHTSADPGAPPPQPSVTQRKISILHTSLYALCKAIDTPTAKDAAETLRECISSYQELLQEQQLQLSQGITPDVSAQDAEQLSFIRSSHEQELQRLEKMLFYQDPDLRMLLKELLSLIN